MKSTLRSSLYGAAKCALLAPLLAGTIFASAAMADTLRVIGGNPKTLDPIVTTAEETLVHAYLIYDKLFEFDKTGKPRPALADTVEVSGDSKTWTITLRKGIKFSDGTPISADDAIQSLKRWGARDSTGMLMAGRTKDIVKIDDSTLRVELKEPFDVPEALAGIAGNPAFIMPKRLATNAPTESVTDATGSGPYMFNLATWKPGQTLVYKKNPYYVPRDDEPSYYSGRKEATVDTVEVSYVPDANTAMAALMTKKFDIWLNAPLDNALAFRGNSEFVVATARAQQNQVRPNFLNPPFNNSKAREALSYLMDQAQIGPLMTGDPQFWRTCYSFLTCEGKYGDETAYSGHRGAADVETAKKLLKEAGYDGSPIVILDPTDFAPFHATALYVAQQLRQAGANVDLQAMDWATLTSRRTSKLPVSQGGWNLMPSGFETEPASLPTTHLMLAANCGDAWFGWPCDSEIEDLRAKFVGEVDDAKKKALAVEIQKRASAILPFIMTGESNYVTVYGADIESFNPAATRTYFWNVKRKNKQ